MKLLQIAFHFEYSEIIEQMLDRHGIAHYVRYPMIEGKDSEGKHYGTQVHPGNTSVVQALVPEQVIEKLFNDLRTFREQKPSHKHLTAFTVSLERTL